MNQKTAMEQHILESKRATSKTGRNSVGYDLITAEYHTNEIGEELKSRDQEDYVL